MKVETKNKKERAKQKTKWKNSNYETVTFKAYSLNLFSYLDARQLNVVRYLSENMQRLKGIIH